MIRINLNGKEESVPAQTPLQNLLENKGFNAEDFIIVYNENVLAKEDLPEIILKETDNVEILRFLGGG